MDIDAADYAMVLRVPGIGLRSAQRIASLGGRGRSVRERLRQMRMALERDAPFIVCPGQPASGTPEPTRETGTWAPVLPSRQGAMQRYRQNLHCRQ